MSRERMRQTIRVGGGVKPNVMRRPGLSGGCDLDFGGGTFDEFIIDLTDEQAKAIRDKLCLSYGLPADAAEMVRLFENPVRPMDPNKLPDEALEICAYITWDWRTLVDLSTSYREGTMKNLRDKLNMLTNAGVIEQRQVGTVREWRKKVISTKDLSNEGRHIYGLLGDEYMDVGSIKQAAGALKGYTAGVIRSCLVQMREGGLVSVMVIEGSSAIGYKRRVLS